MNIFLTLVFAASCAIAYQLGRLQAFKEADAERLRWMEETAHHRQLDIESGTPIASELAREMGITLRAIADIERDFACCEPTKKGDLR